MLPLASIMFKLGINRVLTLIVTISVTNQLTSAKCITNSPTNASDYRLDKRIRPESYNISLKFSEQFQESLDFTVEQCAIIIRLNLNQNDVNLTTIRIHYSASIIDTNVNLHDNNGKSIPVKIGEFDPCTQIIPITLLNDTLDNSKQPYKLIFTNLVGNLRIDNFGVYLIPYYNETKYLVASQFGVAKARHGFPCFDEPSMKATFSISITAPNNYTTVLSNEIIIGKEMLPDGKYVKTTFNTTSKISTYFVGFVISSFEHSSDKDNSNLGVFYAEGRHDCAQYALSLLPKVIGAMEQTLGTSYVDTGNQQIYEVALPALATPAMAQWGLHFYRESVLLHTPEFETNIDRQNVLTYMGRELASNWFGGYVTVDWWSQFWVNAGAATYLSYFVTATVEQDMDLKDQFVIDILQHALETDGIMYDRALTAKENDILHWSEINSVASLITANKGASVLRMIENIITTPKFYAAFQRFLQKHKYSTVKPSDLLEEFEAEGLPSETMREWTEEAGYPVVTVKRNNNDAVLTQNRFLIQRYKSKTEWHIPITYATEATNKDFNLTIPSYWMDPTKELVIPNVFNGSSWIIVNVHATGYYRVNYEERLWEDILKALNSENFGGIPPINRAQLIDDVMNMAKIMRQSYGLAMEVIKYLKNEIDYYPWSSAYNAFDYLLKRIGSRKELNALLKKYIYKLSHQIDFFSSPNTYLPAVGDSHVIILRKVKAIEWACRCGSIICITKSKQQFAIYKADPYNYKIYSNMHYAIFCNGIRYGTVSDWNFLFDQYIKSNISTEQKKMLNALGCSREPAILMRFLEMTIIYDAPIRTHDRYRVFGAIIQSNVDVAFDFFKLNLNEITKWYASYDAISIIITLLTDHFSTISQIEEFKKFLYENHEHFLEADAEVAQSLIKTAEANVKWLTTFEDELTDWLKNELNGSSHIGNGFVLIIVFVAILIM